MWHACFESGIWHIETKQLLLPIVWPFWCIAFYSPDKKIILFNLLFTEKTYHQMRNIGFENPIRIPIRCTCGETAETKCFISENYGCFECRADLHNELERKKDRESVGERASERRFSLPDYLFEQVGVSLCCDAEGYLLFPVFSFAGGGGKLFMPYRRQCNLKQLPKHRLTCYYTHFSPYIQSADSIA